MGPNFIPYVDPNPLPAPYWVFKLLLIVTFVLHIIAMNFLLGSAVLALIAKWRPGNIEQRNRAFADIAKKLPVFLPATITLGIAPLLFVQVLYGQFFYTSSVIMAWPWFLVLVFLTIAYYGFYYVSFQQDGGSGKGSSVMLVSVLLVFTIGFIYSNNFTLSQRPSRWQAKYLANPGGWNLNLSEPTLIARFLHFFTAAVAVGGLMLVFLALARSKKDSEYGKYLFQFGGKAFLYATMAQFVIGTLFVLSLPDEVRSLFFRSGLAMMLLGAGATGGLASIFLMSEALHKNDIRRALHYVVPVMAVVIPCMAVLRDTLRGIYLKPYFHPQQFAVKTQWSVLPFFLVLFVAGVALWFVMLYRYGLFTGAKKAAVPSADQSQPAVPAGLR
jgi:hypothetical protein